MSLSSSDFSNWLLHQFFLERRKAPTAGALKNALRTLSAQAQYAGERHAVHLRAAEHGEGSTWISVTRNFARLRLI